MPAKTAKGKVRAAYQANAPKATKRASEGDAKGLVRPAKTKYIPKTAGPTSTESERLKAIHTSLDATLKRLFADVEPIFSYGMHGWKVPRRKTVAWTTGTMDPNWLQIGIAERAAGITLHIWNPAQWDILAKNKPTLGKAGFKVMVGCLQFNKKADYPLDAIARLLANVQTTMDAER